MMRISWAAAAPWIMLLGSNVFMTFAWYGHLKRKAVALPVVILVSWLIALPEYILAVPANRIGSGVYNPFQLKVIQEAITLLVFVVFAALYLDQPIRISTILGFCFIIVGAMFVFLGRW
jgi:uncharacterized protein (DUF486 family)